MRPVIVYVSEQVCKQEINSVVHELHPSTRVKGLYADNISSQQGAAASCSTLSSLTAAKYCSYRAPRAQHSLSHCNLQSLHPKDHQSCCSAHHPPHLLIQALASSLSLDPFRSCCWLAATLSAYGPILFMQQRAASFQVAYVCGLQNSEGLTAWYQTDQQPDTDQYPETTLTLQLIISLVPLLSNPLDFNCGKTSDILKHFRLLKGQIPQHIKGIVLLKMIL